MLIQTQSSPPQHLITSIVSAIYRCEGGEHTKYPYGIKSVKVKSKEDARIVCENTVRNEFNRLHVIKLDKYFIYMLADRYCPLKSDKQGNENWKINMVRILHIKD